MPARLLLPVLLPVRVKVRLPVPEATNAPVPVKVSGLALFEPEASILPPLAVNVNRRLVVWAAEPLYCNVPPSKTRSAAEPPAEPFPMLLLVLTAASVLTFRMPPLIVVVPLKEEEPVVTDRVPLPSLVKLPPVLASALLKITVWPLVSKLNA